MAICISKTTETYFKRRIKKNNNIFILFCFVLLFHSAQEIIRNQVLSLVPSQLSTFNTNPIIISTDHIANTFDPLNKLTLSFEYHLLLNSFLSTNLNVPLFSVGGSSTQNLLNLKNDGTFDIDTSSLNITLIPPLQKQTAANKILVFHFLVEIEVNVDIKVFYLNFGNSATNVRPYDLVKSEIASVSYSNLVNQRIIEIVVNSTPDYHTHVKNVYFVNKIFSPASPEYHDLYKGVATLRQAIYFYMEPANSKFLLNRSKFNFAPAMNGKPGTPEGNFFSKFSTKTNFTNWMYATFEKEYLMWDIAPHFQSSKTHSVTMLFNIEAFIKNTSPGYISSASNEKHILFRIFSESGRKMFNLKLILLSLDTVTFTASLMLRFVQFMNGTMHDHTFTDTFDANSKLSLRSLVFTFWNLKESTTNIDVQLKGNGISGNNSFFSVEYPEPLEDAFQIRIGSQFSDQNIFFPMFVINLVDCQLFSGGYFLSQGDSEGDLSAISKDELVNVHCSANPRVSRPSSHSSLDAIHRNLLKQFDNCFDRPFNSNCQVSNCEICAEQQCLVCAPFYVMVSGNCVLSTLDPALFDLFARVNINSYANTTPLYNGSIKTANNSFVQSTDILYGNVRFQHNDNPTMAKTSFILTDTAFFGLTNSKDANSYLKSEYFDNESFNDKPLDFGPGNYSFDLFEGSADLNINSINNFCNNETSILKGSKYQTYCSNKISDFSNSEYFPPVLNDTEPQPIQTYLYTFSKSTEKFYFKCQNNCECGTSVSKNSCSDSPGNCALGQQEIIYSYEPFMNECFDCPVHCSICSFGYCLSCDSSTTYDSKPLVIDGVSSKYQDCSPCHETCTEGCTGPLEQDCVGWINPNVVCEPPCQKCDNDSNCIECIDYPLNVIFQFNFQNGLFENTNTFYCEACEGSCKICTSSLECVCDDRPSSLFLSFDETFNICNQVLCPENCLECSPLGLCLNCKSLYSLIDGTCVLDAIQSQKCELQENEECTTCKRGFGLDTESGDCVKCTSNCQNCVYSSNSLYECSDCHMQMLFLGKCMMPPSSALSWSLGQFTDFKNSFAYSMYKTLSDKKNSSCLIKKNDFSEVCKKCKPSYFLLGQSCIRCPSLSKECHSSVLTNTTQITSCEPLHFYNQKFRKCMHCPNNCLTCSERGCTKCVPSFELLGQHCVSCNDPNCKVCSFNSKCVMCFPGFFVDVNTHKCQACSEFCLHCVNGSSCQKCADSHFLDSNSQCQQKCNLGTSFFDSSLKKCISCSKCSFCYNQGPTICSSCDVCKSKCQFDFKRISDSVLSLSSSDVIFPLSTQLSITFFSDEEVSVSVQPNEIQFSLPASPLDIQAVLHAQNLPQKKCSITSDIPLLLSSVDSTPFVNSKEAEMVAQAISYGRSASKTGFVLSALTPQSLNLNSMILLLNLNMLFNYSCIKYPPTNGLSYYFHKLSSADNFETSLLSPLSPNHALSFSASINEFNVKVLPLISFQFIISVLFLIVFGYLSCCFMSLQDLQVKELFPLFRNKHMNKPWMKKFFKIYKKKLSTRKMNLIILHFKKTKEILQSSSLNKIRRKFMRSLYLKRYTILFFFLQSVCIELAHISAKFTKIFTMTKPNMKLVLLAYAYHILLGSFCFISWIRFREHHHFLSLYVKKSKREYIQEFVLLSCNLPFTFFTIFYVYFLLLFSNRLSHSVLFFILGIIYFAGLLIEIYYTSFCRKFIIFRMICNAPILAVFHFSLIQLETPNSLFFDFLFVYLNFSRILLYIYECVYDINEKSVDLIIQEHNKKKS